MKTNDHTIKGIQFHICSWIFVTVSLLLALTTPFLWHLYVKCHWESTRWSLQLQSDVASLAKVSSSKTDSLPAKERFDRMRQCTNGLMEASSEWMEIAANYRRTGILSLIFSILAFTIKPRYAGFLSLPFALYAAWLAMLMT